MGEWHILTFVGEDKPGIVARVTRDLYAGHCNLGECSMLRMAGTFTIMMCVQRPEGAPAPETVVAAAARELGLHVHSVPIQAPPQRHAQPDVVVTVAGADRAGIVAQVTAALDGAGFNVLSLESTVAGTRARPVYLMTIEGQALRGVETLEQALDEARREGVEVDLRPVDTCIG